MKILKCLNTLPIKYLQMLNSNSMKILTPIDKYHLYPHTVLYHFHEYCRDQRSC